MNYKWFARFFIDGKLIDNQLLHFVPEIGEMITIEKGDETIKRRLIDIEYNFDTNNVLLHC